MEEARRAGVRLKYIGTPVDFRVRLNETACSGCHQTRAIAGFHFPGADRDGTPAANAVLLPGSPHFYGDQPRRMQILKTIAASGNERLSDEQLATSYASRPAPRFASRLRDTALIGGWGGTCTMPSTHAASERKWNCKDGLTCVQLFKSKNDPGTGTCVPANAKQVGDAVQRGTISSPKFDKDNYVRTEPKPVTADNRIKNGLPNAPDGNSYYGAHQEWYQGQRSTECKAHPATKTCREELRDQKTGGFPAGSLRLSECKKLPGEATCGLIASTGFNRCIERLGTDPKFNITTCFRYFTSFAGMRACDAASPCRDDYICVQPMLQRGQSIGDLFEQRQRALQNPNQSYWKDVNGDEKYDPGTFGQSKPDKGWSSRNDRRGLCIPPYFVFQFRSDGHPKPKS